MNVAGASITVSARVGSESVDQIPDRFAEADFPIELALPWQYRMWEEAGQEHCLKGWAGAANIPCPPSPRRTGSTPWPRSRKGRSPNA